MVGDDAAFDPCAPGANNSWLVWDNRAATPDYRKPNR